MSTEEREWQKLCDQVAKETDPHRLSELVDQIIEALDARKNEHRPRQQPRLDDNL
jgi:hypothetical protein